MSEHEEPIKNYWVHDRSKSNCYCPLDIDEHGNVTRVSLGMNVIQFPAPENTIGEFWWDESDALKVKIYQEYRDQFHV